MPEHSSEESEVQQLLQQDREEIPDSLPILPVENFVLYPYMIAPILVQDDASQGLIDEAVRGNRFLGIFTRIPEEGEEAEREKKSSESNGQSDNGDQEPESEDREERRSAATDAGFDDIPRIGTAATILKMLRLPDGSIRLLAHGVSRVQILKQEQSEPYLRAKVLTLEEATPTDAETRALIQNAQSMLQGVVQMSSLPEDLSVAAANMKEPGKLADLIASNLPLSIRKQQEILEMHDVKLRLRRILEILSQESQVLEIGSRIQDEVKSRMDQRQREYYLREQMRAIKRELGEEGEQSPEIGEIEEKLENADLPDHAREAAEKELERLKSMTPAAAEYNVVRNYLDWILSLPWRVTTEDEIDIDRAERILDEDHYDLEKIKERILEYLAVIQLRKTIRGPILCFHGPPGTGKTSLGKSIARALGRKFQRISLGGMRDEAEIRGHRRTYIGAMPGRIITALKNCESANPVLMLDEIDKLGSDFRGDPASALLEVLDPEQNSSFSDHYLELPFDLSQTMFITTANRLDTIPGPLRDRMEVLTLSGYTYMEKLEIAKRYLVPRAYENTGVNEKKVVFRDDAIKRIIADYTREAGLRNLERELHNVCRKVARKVAGNKRARKTTVSAKHVPEYLGAPKFYSETADRTAMPGVSVGLAWTPVGGEILFIEASGAEGEGKLTMTGSLGDVMRESAQAAMTYLRSNGNEFGIPPEDVKSKSVHLHIPAGAIPKDGPSAGVAIAVALASLFRDTPMREKTAMTGEITLMGNVLQVGGVKEKVLAAHRAGIREVYLPKRNEKDLEDIPGEVAGDIEFHFVDRIGDVLESVFEPRKKVRKTAKKSAKKATKKTGAKRSSKKSSRKKSAKRTSKTRT